MRLGNIPSLRRAAIPVAALAGAALVPLAAEAYVGPGAGLTAIGTMVALVAAVLLAIVGFVWYPLKRLLRRNKSQTPPADEAESRR